MYSVARDNSLFLLEIFETEMEKNIRALLQTSWNSCSMMIQTTLGLILAGKRLKVYFYRGPSFSALILEQDTRLDESDSCKC